jgi:hypothetical protein
MIEFLPLVLVGGIMSKEMRSAIAKLPPHQRKKLLGQSVTRIVLGVNIHAKLRSYQITDSQFDKHKRQLRDLCLRGEIELFEDGKPFKWPARKPRPADVPPSTPVAATVVAEPAPAPEPEEPKEAEPTGEPEEEPEEEVEEEPEDEPEEENYTLTDLKKMRKPELLKLAESMELDVDPKDSNKKLVAKSWKAME